MTQSQFNSFNPELQAQLTAQGIQITPDQPPTQAAPSLAALSALGISAEQLMSLLSGKGAAQMRRDTGAKLRTVKFDAMVSLGRETVWPSLLFDVPENFSADDLADLADDLLARGFPIRTSQKREERGGNSDRGGYQNGYQKRR